MKKMKKPTVVVLSIILVFALTIGALAAVYILQQAKVNIFSGHLDFSHGGQPSDDDQADDQAELVVKLDGIEIGHECAVTGYGEDAIPVLADVRSRHVDWNHYVWEDKDGNQALAAKEFVLTAKNGSLDNLTFNINLVGNDSIVSAMRFGLITEYYDDSESRMTCLIQSFRLDGTSLLPDMLGDGNIVENEEIKVSVVAWADAYALADLERFDDMGFDIDIIFSAGDGQ